MSAVKRHRATPLPWCVTKNGVMPPMRTFGSFDEAVAFVREQTGESQDRIKESVAAGCPVMDGDTEYDIEEAKS